MMNRRYVLNAAANAAAFLAQLVVSFALAPVVLHRLGDARYGAFGFVESLIAYLTLCDLGIAAALVRFVPRAVADADNRALNRLFSAAFTFFLGTAVLVVAIGVLFYATLVGRLLSVPAELTDDFFVLYVVAVGQFALTLPMGVFPAMLDGLNQFVAKSATRAAVLILRIPLTLFALQCDRPLAALAWVVAGASVVEHFVLAATTWYFAPNLRYRPFDVDRVTIRTIWGYSAHSFLAMVAGRLSFHTDAFVIGAALGPAAITIFNFPARLVETGKSLLRSGTTTLTPVFSRREHDAAGSRELFLTASRAALFLGLPLQLGLWILGKPFLARWLGPDYAERCAPTLMILASVLALSIAQSVAARFLYGTGRIGVFSRVTVAEGIVNLLTSVLLVGRYGVEGVAFGTAVPHAAFCVFTIAYSARQLGVGWREYWRQVVRWPFLASCVPALVWWALRPQSFIRWIDFLAVGLAGVLAHAITVVLMVPGVRRRLPIGRIGGILARPLAAWGRKSHNPSLQTGDHPGTARQRGLFSFRRR